MKKPFKDMTLEEKFEAYGKWGFDYEHIPHRHEIFQQGLRSRREQDVSVAVLQDIHGRLAQMSDGMILAALQATNGKDSAAHFCEYLIPACIAAQFTLDINLGRVTSRSANFEFKMPEEEEPEDPIEAARRHHTPPGGGRGVL